MKSKHLLNKKYKNLRFFVDFFKDWHCSEGRSKGRSLGTSVLRVQFLSKLWVGLASGCRLVNFLGDILQLIFLYILNKYAYLLFMKMAKIKNYTFVASHLHFSTKILRVKCRMKQGSVVISLSARGNGGYVAASHSWNNCTKMKKLGQSCLKMLATVRFTFLHKNLNSTITVKRNVKYNTNNAILTKTNLLTPTLSM